MAGPRDNSPKPLTMSNVIPKDGDILRYEYDTDSWVPYPLAEAQSDLGGGGGGVTPTEIQIDVAWLNGSTGVSTGETGKCILTKTGNVVHMQLQGPEAIPVDGNYISTAYNGEEAGAYPIPEAYRPNIGGDAVLVTCILNDNGTPTLATLWVWPDGFFELVKGIDYSNFAGPTLSSDGPIVGSWTTTEFE